MPPDLTPESLTQDPELLKLLQSGELPSKPIPATLLGNKLIVFDPVFGSLLYGFERYFGTPVGIHKPRSNFFNRPLELSLFEGLYLLKHQKLFIVVNGNSDPWTHERFYDYACKIFPNFNEKYPIYEDLREKKYIPRPGQKFGADFIVYRKGPGLDHSSFCIQVLSGGTARISSIDIVRTGRLATSVKKRFVLANPMTKTYFQFKWFKP